VSGLTELEAVIRLGLSFLLGAVLGLERETHDRPAGLRTFILVCVGSALVMIVSIGLRDLYAGASGVDPGRIAAQVVTGIGFLGAGTIMHEGPIIRGLTTAAGLWVVSAIGLAVGAGFYLIAATTTALGLTTFVLLARVERSYIGGKGYGLVSVITADEPGQLGKVTSILGERGIDIKDIRLTPREGGLVELELRVKSPHKEALSQAMQAVLVLPSVRSAEYAG
jgi:putative Mg2+ transporter-C (MgtC) family protein